MKQSFLTVDLGFGDSGKGSIVDFLTREYEADLVVRFSGGAQAGHRVVTAELTQRAHVFSQFGAGTLAGADTFLSRFMMVEPFALLAEAEHLQTLGIISPLDRITIDGECLVTTPFHRAVNRLKEVARGQHRHGSCGMGVGETMADFVIHKQDVLLIRDFLDKDTLYAKLSFLKSINQYKVNQLILAQDDAVQKETAVFQKPSEIDKLVEAYSTFAKQIRLAKNGELTDRLQECDTAVFEASQGVLLDEWFGFHPHTTWSTVTLANAETLLREANYDGKVSRIGITRAYSTRHGAGPFVTEDVTLSKTIRDAVNGFDDWQEGFRVGALDMVLLNYAKQVAGKLDYLAVCHLDRLAEFDQLQLCNAYSSNNATTLQSLPIKSDLEDLEHQETLTALLNQCTPQLTAVSSPQALLSHIEKRLKLPVGIESWGETAVDKILKIH